ncbi:uncharacterized protein V1518DRAFT_413974 [Limtongia smithiae]|uniref:uncharacterized protein n=1 Tax=Limtongia smithiae TaxID=1125753 RepID=UPI0034CE032E
MATTITLQSQLVAPPCAISYVPRLVSAASVICTAAEASSSSSSASSPDDSSCGSSPPSSEFSHSADSCNSPATPASVSASWSVTGHVSVVPLQVATASVARTIPAVTATVAAAAPQLRRANPVIPPHIGKTAAAKIKKATTLPARSKQHSGALVDSLVDSAKLMIEGIWPSTRERTTAVDNPTQILPLREFIEETLRRSRTSYSTLQVALYYLFLLRPYVQDPEKLKGSMGALNCGRRAFLTSLMLASKYLQDKNYSARAWSKISGLTTAEINANELAFLKAVDWRVHVPDHVFVRWSTVLLNSVCVVGSSKRQQQQQQQQVATATVAAAAAARAVQLHTGMPQKVQS